MEQTTNVFNKGLQTDTHPMVQGNDTLSDALNATLVTMNSNEVVLQNDMGNAKIDNAYLPPGYQPVGMKEYGGIIYVAAYNPITNKSQIGSFPSPERKISVEDKDLGNTIKLDTDFRSNKLEGINFLNNDILLIPLTSDTSLHAGDKFTVYSSYVWENKDNITNFDNNINDVISNLRKLYEAEEDPWKKGLIRSRIYILQSYLLDNFNSNKVYSPKNKKYTLSLGILNSQNEFVDITKSLVRWKDIDGERPTKEENESDSAYNERLKTYRESIKPIEFTNESDLIKFNTGYFIAKDFEDPLEEYTGNDKELIAERQKMAVNSYAYKLIGPLYLKAELNHIKNFNFSIEGTKIPSENNKAEILIKATITYNCPDGIDTISGECDNNYFDYFVGKLKDESIFPGFHLYKKSGETYEREYTTTETEEQQDENNNITIVIKDQYDEYHNTPKTKYNPETNLYEVTIEKKYIISPTSDNKYEYYVCIPSGYKNKDGDDIYIKGLSTKGEIDFTKLGSGTLKVNEWRFYNTMPTEDTEGSTLLTYGFSAYPRIGHSFTDLKVTLKYSKFKIGLLIDQESINTIKAEERVAAEWFLEAYPDNGIIITPSTLNLIKDVNTLWINIDRDGISSETINGKIIINLPRFYIQDAKEAIEDHIKHGGNLYLTKFASYYVNILKRFTDNRIIFKNQYYNLNSLTGYPKLNETSNDISIYKNMIKAKDNKYYFIENGYGQLFYRFYGYHSISDAEDNYKILGREFFPYGLSAECPSIIEFYPKTIKENNKVILDQKGTILMDGSIYQWTGSLNILKHNVETLTSNCLNYLNLKRNKILDEIDVTENFGISGGNITFNWKGLETRTLYDVIISYKEKDENDQYIQENGSDKVFTINNEWILTTKLFNNCYSTDSLDFVEDYAKFNNLGKDLPDGLKYLVDKLLVIKLDVNENIEYNSTVESDYSNFKKLISKDSLSNSNTVNSSVKNIYHFEFNLNNPSLNIVNKELYPEYINLSTFITNNLSGKISFDSDITKDKLQKYVSEYKCKDTIDSFEDIIDFDGSIPTESTFIFGKNNKIFSITSHITQKIESEFTEKNITIQNCFNSFDSIFQEDNSLLKLKEPWCSFGAKSPGDCSGESPKIEMYIVQDSNKRAAENLLNATRIEKIFEMGCHNGDQVDVYNFSTYFDRISEFFNKNHENSQFIAGITNYHEAHGNGGINAANTLNYYHTNKADAGDYIFIAWIRTQGGWVPFYFSTDSNIEQVNNKTMKNEIINSDYYQSNLKYFHTNFKSSETSKKLNVIKFGDNENCHYINPYNFSFPIQYTIEIDIAENDLIITTESNLQFKVPHQNIISNRTIYIMYKSNERFDNAIEYSKQSYSDEILYSYDVDLDTLEDSEYNILQPEVKYIEVNSKLVKDFKESNNIKNYSENDGVKIFSFPKQTVSSSTYPQTSLTQYSAHAKDSGEGLSVIGLKFDIGAKKFVTNGR